MLSYTSIVSLSNLKSSQYNVVENLTCLKFQNERKRDVRYMDMIISIIAISEKSNKKLIHNLLYYWPILSFISILNYFWSAFSVRSCCGNISTLRKNLHKWFSLYQLLKFISLHFLNSYLVVLHFYLLSLFLVHWLLRIPPNRLRHDFSKTI